MSDNKQPNYRWIQFQIDTLLDPDLIVLTDAALGAYLKMYLLAGRADSGGLLCNSHKVFTLQDLVSILRIQSDSLKSYIAELSDAGLVGEDSGGYRIIRFLDEQGPGDESKRAQWRERQRLHREKVETSIKEEQEREDKMRGHGDVTGCHSDVTNCHGDRDKPSPLPLGLMVSALAKVTGLDSKLNYGRLAKEAKDLCTAGYAPEQVQKVYGTGGSWWTMDWRGKKGEIPQIGVIRSTISQLLNAKLGGKSSHPTLQSQTEEETMALFNTLKDSENRKGGEV